MEPKAKPSNTGSKKLFHNPILEILTRTHISITIVIFILLPVALLYYGLSQGYINNINAIGLFFGGMVSFTFVEYLMHRFLFHISPTTPGREKFARIVHGAHHEFPKDKDRISMPPLPMILLILFFFGIFWLMLGNYVFGFVPGFYVGYLLYTSIHYAIHAYQPPKNFLKILWVHHGIHHYKDPENAFGVSSPFWDFLFGTLPKK